MDTATYEQLQDYNARRPFRPFWVKLADGEVIHITEPNRAVVMREQFVFTPDRKRLRRIPLDCVGSYGALSPHNGSQGEDQR